MLILLNVEIAIVNITIVIQTFYYVIITPGSSTWLQKLATSRAPSVSYDSGRGKWGRH